MDVHFFADRAEELQCSLTEEKTLESCYLSGQPQRYRTLKMRTEKGELYIYMDTRQVLGLMKALLEGLQKDQQKRAEVDTLCKYLCKYLSAIIK